MWQQGDGYMTNYTTVRIDLDEDLSEFGSDVTGWYGIDRKGVYCTLEGSKSYLVNFSEVKSE